MGKLIYTFWQICTFKMAPQDLSSSNNLLFSSALAYALISILIAALSLSPGQALASGLLDVALMGAMTQLLLWIRELTSRFYQTFVALMGSGALIGFIAWPFLIMQSPAGGETALLPLLVIVGLMIWNVAIVAHILRHAIGAPFFVGVGMSLIYMYISVSIMTSLFSSAV